MNHPGNHSISVRSYIIAFAWLVVLTLIEIGVVFLKLDHHVQVIMILATAIGKALLIALFFMHLKFEKALVWLLPGIPVVLGLIFVFALFPDHVYHLTHIL